LLDDGGKPYVFVVSNDAAHRVDIVPGNTAGDQITVLQGLVAGNRVVIEGGTALEDGMKVRERGKR
jgi:multidrug efflux pump subunit AcrA (membrane-fusion protein)